MTGFVSYFQAFLVLQLAAVFTAAASCSVSLVRLRASGAAEYF